MRASKTLLGAGGLIGAAILGGAMISGALASSATTASTTARVGQTETGADSTGASTVYADAYLDALASELGVDRSELGPAALAAAEAAISAAVDAGTIDEDVADALRERLAELEDPERLLVGPPGLHRPGGPGRGSPGRPGGPGEWQGPGGFGHRGGFLGPVGLGISQAASAAADALGMDVDNLVAALRDGQSLEDVASDQGVDYSTVTAAVLDSVRTSLDDAVADGGLGQEQADMLRSRLETWLDNGGSLSFGGFRGHPGGPWSSDPDGEDNSGTQDSSVEETSDQS